MNPIPLSAPDGRIYAYACGRCHHVAGGSSMMVRLDVDGPHANLATASQRDAESCCLCRDCGEVIVNGWDCVGCSWWRWFSRIWLDIGTARLWNIATVEEWQRHFRDEDDDEDHES